MVATAGYRFGDKEVLMDARNFLKRRVLGLGVVAIAGTLSISPAVAGSITPLPAPFVAGLARAESATFPSPDYSDSRNYSQPFPTNPVLISAQTIFFSNNQIPNGSSLFRSGAFVSNGNIGLQSYGSAIINSWPNNYLFEQGVSEAYASDRFTVSGSTSFIDVAYSINIHGYLSTYGPADFTEMAYLYFYQNVTYKPDLDPYHVGEDHINVSPYCNQSTDTYGNYCGKIDSVFIGGNDRGQLSESHYGTLHIKNNSELILSFLLYLENDVASGFMFGTPNVPAGATFDARSTAYIMLTPLAADTIITSASGLNYASSPTETVSVAEPGAMALVFWAGLLLTGTQRRLKNIRTFHN